jgi:subtilisin family serine protease
MEATSHGKKPFHSSLALVCIFSLAALGAGCSQSSGVRAVTTSDCANQAQEKSFLVKWKGQVPAAYQSLRIHPGSLTTVFRDIAESDLERQVLRFHEGEYEIAEHEFSIQNVNQSDVTIASGTLPPAVWAPQDIQVSEAWQFLGVKGEGVTVAVIDSGVDVSHPLLQKEIWSNPGETGLDAQGRNKATNGIDDDNDGYVDDVFGWDFADGSANAIDDNSHGTHVAGIIAGQAQTSTNFTGVAPNAKIMALRFIDSGGNGSVTDAISSIEYASAHGAKVINASWGGSTCSSILKQNIETAAQHGTVFVNAAGNDGLDISRSPEWPAVYQLAGKITVGAYNLGQVLSTFSNFGQLVDLAGPGESILSTVPPGANGIEGQMGGKSGTSMATPYVAGVVALLYSAKPSATIDQISAAINNSVIGGRYGVRTGGKLNALNAAKYLMSH